MASKANSQSKLCKCKLTLIVFAGDKGALVSRYGGVIVKGLIMASVFFQMPKDAIGTFSRGGFLFFCLTFNSLISQSELATFMQGRGVLAKHRSFALYRPAFFYLAQVVADIPLAVIQVVIFQVCVYFMAGLNLTAGQVNYIGICILLHEYLY